MNLKEIGREELEAGLKDASTNGNQDHVRVLFAPVHIDKSNLNQVLEMYGTVNGETFDTVVILEDSKEPLRKHLPMPSNMYFETPLGRVPANDQLRNEFCDEEDDFFVDDYGFNAEMSMFDQLMMLQTSIGEFSVVSIQLSVDERPSVVRELAYVLGEVLGLRSSLLVCCTSIKPSEATLKERLVQLYRDRAHSNLLNTIFSDDTEIEGRGSLVAGLMVAREWECELEFAPTNGKLNGEAGSQSLFAGYAIRRNN